MSGIVLPNGKPASSSTSEDKPKPKPIPDQLWLISDTVTGSIAQAVFWSMDEAVRTCINQQKQDFSLKLKVNEYRMVAEYTDGDDKQGEQGDKGNEGL